MNRDLRRMACGARAIVAAWLVAAGFGASTGRSQNVVPNPNFDADASGWDLSTGGGWDATDDADGCAGGVEHSGSLEAQSLDVAGTTYSVAAPSFCLNVTPGEVIYAEVAAITPVLAGAFPLYFPQADCGGEPDQVVALEAFGPFAKWSTYATSFTVPPSRYSMRVLWEAIDEGGSTYTTHWDRAYVGRSERVFVDDFGAGRLCRWVLSGPDVDPPSAPGAIVSPSHDGGPAPAPIEVQWGASFDVGGSGLAGYRIALDTGPSMPLCSNLPTMLYVDTTAVTYVSAGTYYVFVCAEDNEGNLSDVTVGGPYEVP